MRHLLVLLLLPAGAAFAGETRLVPDEYSTIQEAIAASTDGDRVLVGPGVWAGHVDTRNLAITIESSLGAATTVLDASQSGTVVKIIRGEGPDTVLRGFTLTGGVGTLHEGQLNGGGLWIVDSSPTIDACVFSGNAAQMGAGASVVQGNPTFTDCTFIDNFATVDGGGIRFTQYSYPTLDHVVFLNNGASVYGGAINYAFNSLGMHDTCVFEGNTAGIHGGAISMTCDCSAANVRDSDFCNSQPDHIIGPWNDLGGNSLCPDCLADVTADGMVGVSDILAIISAWGGCICVEDLNNDSAVSVDDLLIVLDAFGPCPG